MKGYGEDTESKRGNWIETIGEGAVTQAIQRMDELYPMWDKLVRKYFRQFSGAKVNSIIRDGWQITCRAKINGHYNEIEWCRILLRVQWPSAIFQPNWCLHIDRNQDLKNLDPGKYRLCDEENMNLVILGHY